MLHKNRSFALSLAYAQLVFSALLAVSIIFGYVEFRATVGQFSQSLAATIVSTANVIGQTAETIQTKKNLFDDALATLSTSRKIVEELRTSVRNQTANMPKYAEGLHLASGYFLKAGDEFSKLGDDLMFSIPTNIQFEGIKPVLVLSKPLEERGRSLKEHAQKFSGIGLGLEAISSSLANDGKNLRTAITDTSDNAIRLLNETEKVLTSLKSQNLPQAIAELKSASENLHSASRQVNLTGNLGLVLLVAGLLLSSWCFLNSLTVLHLAKKSVSLIDDKDPYRFFIQVNTTKG